MTMLNGIELKPFVMTWGQRKELRRRLGVVYGRVEKLASQLLDATTADLYGDLLGKLSLKQPELQEAILLFVYADQGLTQALIDGAAKRSEVSAAVAEFLELNQDPEEEEATKKVKVLLATVSA